MDFIENLKETGKNHKIKYINIIPSQLKEGFNSCVVALLPYYAGERKSHFSKYTRGKDYHIIGRKIMEDILDDLNIKEREIYIDISPFNERELAFRAGLGVKGKNGLLINQEYGSYVFIMTAFINSLYKGSISETKSCIGCLSCVDACPGKAIKSDGIDYNKCVSFITQKRQIDKIEENIIKENNYYWGCDICQDVCPMNRNIKQTEIPELKEDLLLEINDINDLSNKEFKNKYKDYSFAYRGKKVLKRNIDIIKGENK